MSLAAFAALVVSTPLMAQERAEVIERIKPVGQVAIEGQAQAADTPAAAPAAAPAPEVAAPEAAPAQAAAPEAAATPAEPAPATAAPATPVASADSADSGEALYTAKGCVACHGAGGKAPIMPTYPKVAALPEPYIVNQMKDIKSGARSNGQSAVMKGIMATVSDEEMQAIAAWLSKQPR
jgi:cytochrome c553